MLSWAVWKNWYAVPFDFGLRYNEVTVLRAGHDPFDIWMGKTVLAGYQPYVGYGWHKNKLQYSAWAEHLALTGETPSGKRIHAYPPWQYTLVLPFTYMPFKTASFVWLQMLLLLTAGGVCASYVFGKSLRGDVWDGVLLASGLLIAATPALNHSYAERQWGPVVLAGLAGLFWFMRKNREFAAGLCWALVMVKPQFGILLFLPLALARKWKTIAVAVSACLLLALPPAVMAGKSPVEMILNIRDLGAGFFLGSGFVPWPILMEARRVWPDSAGVTLHTITFGTVAGLALCVWAVRRLRGAPLENQLAAAVVCSLAWTYCNITDYILYMAPLAVIFALAVRDSKARLWAWASFAIVFFSSMLAISLFLRITKAEIAAFLRVGENLAPVLLLPFILALIVFCWLIPLAALLRMSRDIRKKADTTC